jgi:hypothetical protein
VGTTRRSTTLASMTRLLPQNPDTLILEYQTDYTPEARMSVIQQVSTSTGQHLSKY